MRIFPVLPQLLRSNTNATILPMLGNCIYMRIFPVLPQLFRSNTNATILPMLGNVKQGFTCNVSVELCMESEKKQENVVFDQTSMRLSEN